MLKDKQVSYFKTAESSLATSEPKELDISSIFLVETKKKKICFVFQGHTRKKMPEIVGILPKQPVLMWIVHNYSWLFKG